MEQGKILNDARENKKATYEIKAIRIIANFSTEILKARRAQSDVFQAMNDNTCQPRLLYPSGLYFINEEVKTFQDKQKVTFTTVKSALQKTLKNKHYKNNKTPFNNNSNC
jgi:hypothetical protein